MEGKRLLERIRLTNFLSYGPEGVEIHLQPLNVLIGANGSGKSNLIEALSILQAAPTDLSKPIREGGGMAEWPWKGGGGSPAVDLRVEATVSYPDGPVPLKYWFQLRRVGWQLEVADEGLENASESNHAAAGTETFYGFREGVPVLRAREQRNAPPGTDVGRRERRLDPRELISNKSVLSQRKDPDQYPELTYLGRVFSEISLFRECHLGRKSPLRGPQDAAQQTDFLLENGGNLALVLNDLSNQPAAWRVLLEQLRRFYPDVEAITTKVQSGIIDFLFHERDFSEPVVSARLSDGTLRYLCLLSILCHPNPPPLVCIEDPEAGLHPDALYLLAELMIEASQRTQLVVTTHSDVLVSAMTEAPEAVVVVERDAYGSHLYRLQPDKLKHWLKRYSLGDVWRIGEIGGNP
jgi:predicted ATPase